MTFRRLCLLLLLALLVLSGARPAAAEEDSLYDVTGESAVHGENYVQARERAVDSAFQNGLAQALRDLVGESVYQENRKSMSRLVESAPKFVKSYRFLNAEDSAVEKVSRVHLEVTFFRDAINQELNSLGVMKSVVKERSVIVLINEKSLSTKETPPDFWDYVPIAEVALMQNLFNSGIEVIGRSQARELIDEQAVLDAGRGDIAAAVNIGLRVGADIVVIGNAISSHRGTPVEGQPVNIQANLNIKAVSSLRSMMIAARSEFATAEAADEFQGELQAFEQAAKKMSTFLLDAMERYWTQKSQPQAGMEGDAAASGTPPPEPAQPVRKITPRMMDDL